MKQYKIFFLIFSTTLQGTAIIDVVIPCHEKDCITLELAIRGARDNIKRLRRIIVVSNSELTKQAEWFPEQQYPFHQKAIAIAMFKGNVAMAMDYMKRKNSRVDWLYQQLLKLYAPLIIPNIAENVLIIDADTIFQNPVTFFDDGGYALYATRKDVFNTYIEHATRLIPNFTIARENTSGVVHHMLFQQTAIRHLFEIVEQKHQMEFWQAFCSVIDNRLVLSQKPAALLASEYEIYFNFVFANSHKYKVKIRSIKRADINSLELLHQYKNNQYHCVSYHHYLRH